MAWNGSGVFSRLRSWAADAANGLNVQANLMDQDTDDIAAAINNCLTKDGQNAATANLPMGGFRHTGASAGAARDQYATVGQLQDGTTRYCVAGGTANALTLTLTPAVTALVDGMEVDFKAAATCAAGATTAAVNAVAAKSVKRPDGANLAEGDIVNGRDYTLRYVAATDSWTLRNPSMSSIAAVSGLQAALDGKAAIDLSNVSNSDFAAKATAAGVGGGATVSTEDVQDIVAAMLRCTDGTVALTYDDAAGTLTLSQPPGYTHWRVMPTVEPAGAPAQWECYEFRLYQTASSTTNLCTGGTPICNPQGTSIANAFDGNTSTAFQSGLTAGNANTAYIGYRFPARKEVHKLEFATGHLQTTATTCVIACSNDGVLWSPVATVSMPASWSTYTFTW